MSLSFLKCSKFPGFTISGLYFLIWKIRRWTWRMSSGIWSSDLRGSTILSTLSRWQGPVSCCCNFPTPWTTGSLRKSLSDCGIQITLKQAKNADSWAPGLQNQNLRCKAWGSCFYFIKDKHVFNTNGRCLRGTPPLQLPSPSSHYLLFFKVLPSRTGQNSHIRIMSKTTGSNDGIGRH